MIKILGINIVWSFEANKIDDQIAELFFFQEWKTEERVSLTYESTYYNTHDDVFFLKFNINSTVVN